MLGVRCRIVEVTIDIEHVNVARRLAHERLSGAHHDAAVAADQQRNLPRLAQERDDALAHVIPGDPGPGPAPDRRDRVMGQIAGNRHVPLVDGRASGRRQSCQQMSFTIGLRVVFVARVQRAGAERDSQDVIRALGVGPAHRAASVASQ